VDILLNREQRGRAKQGKTDTKCNWFTAAMMLSLASIAITRAEDAVDVLRRKGFSAAWIESLTAGGEPRW